MSISDASTRSLDEKDETDLSSLDFAGEARARPAFVAWGSMFWMLLEDHGERPALVGEDGELVSYAGLARMADATGFEGARRLVLMEIDNSFASTAAYLGALRAGHAVILTNSSTSPSFQVLIDKYRPEIVWTSNGGVDVRSEEPHAPLDPDLAVMLSTSGSTGSAKLVRLSAEAVDANARSIEVYLGIRSDDRAISSLPPSYSYGLSVLNSHMAAGASVILTERSVTDPAFVEAATRLGATSIAGVPYTYELLVASGLIDKLPETIRTLTQAGGRLAPELVERVRVAASEQGVRFFVMYGQTEATARMAFVPPERLQERSDCIGHAIPGGRFELVDPDTGAPQDAAGELVYRGPNVMLGYAQEREDLSRGRDIDALATGDLAEQVEPGIYRITGRKSRFLKIFGLRIALDEVEREAARRGWSAVATGDDSRVVVATEEDRDPGILARELADRFKLPPSRVIGMRVVSFPRLASGKIDYRTLLSLAPTFNEPEGEEPTLAGYAALLARLARKPSVGDDASFDMFAGDSLNYVEASVLLEQALGEVPPGWESMALGELKALVPAEQPVLSAGTRLPRDTHYIQAMRSIAIMLVVASHSWEALPVWSGVMKNISFQHVNLLFIFVAGYLFQYLLQGFSYRRYLDVKLKTVVLPYCIVSIPALVIFLIGWKDPASLHAPAWIYNSKLLVLAYMLVTGSHLGPLWFIPMITLIYLLAPLLKSIDERPNLYWLILPALVLSAYLGRPPNGYENPVQALGYYLPVYMIGMATSHFRRQAIPAAEKYWLLLLLPVFLPPLLPGGPEENEYVTMLTKIIFSFAVLGVLSLHAQKLPDWFDRIGDLSFGIYFVHGYFTTGFSLFAHYAKLPWQGLGWWLCIFAFAMTLSVGVVLATKAIFGPWSRRLIGA